MKRSPSILVVGLAGFGLVLVWSAVHGANLSSSLKDLLAGRPAAPPGADPALLATSGTPAPSGGVVGDTARSALAVTNRLNGQMQAAGYGWVGDQWTALDNLWTRESNWSNTARNPSSGAYGIAQFLDSTWSTVGGTKTSDPTLQIHYGLAYIKARYGSPAAAWSHEQSAGWY